MLTPLEIDKKQFKKVPFGYETKEVDKFIAKILLEYEGLYKENIELNDKISVLNDGISYYKTLERTLQDTLISAEKSANEVKNAAYKNADLIEKEAEIRAKQILADAKNKLYQINQQVTDLYKQYNNSKIKMTQFFNSQLNILNEDANQLCAVTNENRALINELSGVDNNINGEN